MAYLTMAHASNGTDIALTVSEAVLLAKLRDQDAISIDDRFTMQSALERLGRLTMAAKTDRESRL